MAQEIRKIYCKRKDGRVVLFDLEKKHNELDSKINTNTEHITENTQQDQITKTVIEQKIAEIYDQGELPSPDAQENQEKENGD